MNEAFLIRDRGKGLGQGICLEKIEREESLNRDSIEQSFLWPG